MRAVTAGLLMAGWCLMAAAPSLSADLEVYTCADGDLYRLPLVDSSPILVGPTGYHPTALDFAATGQLFAVDPTADILLTVDPETGHGEVVGSLGIDVDEEGSDISFDASGQLWMSSGYSLYTVDTATGAATFQVVSDPGLPVGWIALAFVGTTLYADGGGWIHTIDTATGVATPVWTSGLHVGMDSAQGGLWAVQYSCPAQFWCWTLLTVEDTATGTPIGTWTVAVDMTATGIAVRRVLAPAIPTSGTWGLTTLILGLGAAAVWVIRARAR